MLWEVDIYPSDGEVDRTADDVVADLLDLNLAGGAERPTVVSARGYLIETLDTASNENGGGPALGQADIERLASELLADTVVEQTVVAQVGEPVLNQPIAARSSNGELSLIHVLLKPGVTDTVAQSAQRAMSDYLSNSADSLQVRTLRKFWFGGVHPGDLQRIANKVLANDAIEQVILGPLKMDHLQLGGEYKFEQITVPIRDLDDSQLARLSREGQLYLQLAEMQTIQNYFRELDREPTDIELESLAQTWSEHCSHKTLAGRIAYRDENGERQFENMLKETIFAATVQIREALGDDDWCVSVFKDNAGIVRFEDDWNIAFKVETHNHPSALEPYGGANTGLGGVIRDTLGTGLGAKPVASTDVFCFARPDTDSETLPPGVLHPRRVMKRVVAGVRDYGNRMGIPTVNGAVYFDDRYLGNPLVYCGNVGLIPHDKSFKEPVPGDYIVAVGGRTGRDGIHGATFSSAELTSESEDLSGGAVQIGAAITEKMVADVVLAARDRGLFTAVTDCGAGGFSSAVGEMGEEIGAEVWLERAPTKYDGLSYTELWISEAQERMVLSVPEKNWKELESLCAAENVEATIIGRFEPTGQLVLKYHDEVVGTLPMSFLHDGRPPVVRKAHYEPAPKTEMNLSAHTGGDYTEDIKKILGSLNVASKEWVIRQYDHEVQAGSVIKPLVGVAEDGPGDAAVVRPLLDSQRGIVISCGMNPCYGDLDTYHMAASAIDEAVRNCVAVGGDPSRISLLDNFCWGDCERSETLGSLVRAAIACQDLATAWRMPFISGKDSLNNEFSYEDSQGTKQTIAIPPSLLISAMGQVEDARRCVTMDLKTAGNRLYQVGLTKNEMGGSHFGLVNELTGGSPPTVEVESAYRTFETLHTAITQGLVRSCHDLSEGGLAVAVAEMAFSGGLGARIDLSQVPCSDDLKNFDSSTANVCKLFSESNTRFVCEVTPEMADSFEAAMNAASIPFGRIGEVQTAESLAICETADSDQALVSTPIAELKSAWQTPLQW